MPNLEHWYCLDRSDLFTAITDSDDPLERILAIPQVHSWHSMQAGEHFRSHWDVIPMQPFPAPHPTPIPHGQHQERQERLLQPELYGLRILHHWQDNTRDISGAMLAGLLNLRTDNLNLADNDASTTADPEPPLALKCPASIYLTE
ncbi:hypothetical protein A0H81_04198 [Grifola frondosa]|uniref:Uncharacterized protein n=1 Tax=Grifola frondosa TaxID=5627 RepID=A0A1C7MDV0_GRIFR|nr:hypothetical protein A0H81_04198 [Grifola frondosa]